MKAFPATGNYTEEFNGMDLRDYFAAKAMQAMMTAGFWNWNKPSEDADRCYAQADEMMKARK